MRIQNAGISVAATRMVRVHEMVGPTPTSPTESEDPPAGGDERRAYSKVVLRGIRIAEAGVRFSLGPPNETLSELRKWSDFAGAKIALSIFSKPFPPTAEAVNSQSSPQLKS